tara:strand:- start:48882 stop:50099 length:1218 start_codon:yes stop_codon:yes gene_type:complete
LDDNSVDTKLAAARTRLILDKPFLGALVLRMPLEMGDPSWCITAATDAKKIYFNYEYINQLHGSETQFVLAKQALHCALSHFARRGHRIKQRWDLACEYAVNPILVEEGFSAPPGTLIEDSFTGMTAEEIYCCLQDKEDGDADSSEHQEEGNEETTDPTDEDNSTDPQQNSNQDNSDSGESDFKGSPRPATMSQQEQDNLSVQWQQRLAGAAQQAQQAGKLSESMARMVEFMLQPKLPWRALLARHMTATARDDYNYSRPSSRRGDPSIFPSLRSSQVNMIVAIDISGSIDDKEMNEFLCEIDAIKGQLRARISLLACDAELAEGSPWIFESWEEFALPKTFTGGGGTDFCPVFDWVEKQDQAPELLVYFSDCAGKFPDYQPSYPVIWLVKGKHAVPFGQRIQLN